MRTLFLPIVLAIVCGCGGSPDNALTGDITTSKGVITVLGVAFVDGRDTEATPPLTVMNVNAWDGPERQRRVCSVSHGAQVDLLAARLNENEGRPYFRVSANGCDGWLAALFLSPASNPVVGDEIR